MEKQNRRSGSRELASSPSSRTLSPLRRRSLPLDTSPSSSARKSRPPSTSEDPSSAPIRGLWPSSSSVTSSSRRSSGTLADHLGNDRLINLAHRRASPSPAPPDRNITFSRQRSCSEFRHLDDDDKSGEQQQNDDKQSRKINKSNSSKENHRPIGGSMRYIGNKLLFPRSAKPDSPPSSSFVPSRVSIDESALAASSRKSDFQHDVPSSESDRSDCSNKVPTPRAPRLARHNHHLDRNHETKSAEMNPTGKIAPPSIRRTSSGSAWALSPGRRSGSSPLVDGGTKPAASGVRTFSSLRPPSPGKGKGSMGNFISLGLDLFRKRSAGGGSGSHSSSFGNGSPTGNTAAVGEVGHRFRMAHNRLIQWRFVNARSDAVSRAKATTSQNVLMSAWSLMSKLQDTVMQKQMQLQKEKLGLQISTLVSYQVKSLERWTDMERQHTSALSSTKEHFQAAVCRIPLTEGAKADPQPLSSALRQANDLTSTMKTTISIFRPTAQKMVPLLSELVQVVTEEKSLLEECFELMGLISSLEIEERSLKCHIIQLNSVRSQEQVEARRQIASTK